MSKSTWLPALIDPSLPQAMVAGLIVYVICLIFFFSRRKPIQNFWLALLFVYIGALVSLTMVIPTPGAWHISAKSTQWAIGQINWMPFESAGNMLKNSIRIGKYNEFLRVVGGNFAMLMPLGILIPLINKRFHLGQMIALSLLVPTGIEGLQLLNNILAGTILRSVELEDVILNAAGCLLAYLIFAGLHSLFKPKHKGRSYS
jgi:glycopeptide antibiotics resistance protein